MDRMNKTIGEVADEIQQERINECIKLERDELRKKLEDSNNKLLSRIASEIDEHLKFKKAEEERDSLKTELDNYVRIVGEQQSQLESFRDVVENAISELKKMEEKLTENNRILELLFGRPNKPR